MKYNGEILNELMALLSEDAERYDPYVYPTNDTSKVVLDIVSKSEEDNWDGFILLFNEPNKDSNKMEAVAISVVEAFILSSYELRELLDSYNFVIHSSDMVKDNNEDIIDLVADVKSRLKINTSKLEVENNKLSKKYYMAMSKYFSKIVD